MNRASKRDDVVERFSNDVGVIYGVTVPNPSDKGHCKDYDDGVYV